MDPKRSANRKIKMIEIFEKKKFAIIHELYMLPFEPLESLVRSL